MEWLTVALKACWWVAQMEETKAVLKAKEWVDMKAEKTVELWVAKLVD